MKGIVRDYGLIGYIVLLTLATVIVIALIAMAGGDWGETAYEYERFQACIEKEYDRDFCLTLAG